MTRRAFVLQSSAAGLFSSALAAQIHPVLARQTLFIGTAGRGSKGVYRAEFNANTGQLTLPQLMAPAESPSFLARTAAFHPRLYAVTGGDAGNAAANGFALSADSVPSLTPLNIADAAGPGGCHISVHPDGRSVFVANYTAGSIASFLADTRGLLTRASYIAFPADGHGPDPDRQTKSFAHCAQPSADGSFLFVNDLGLDRIHIFRLERATAKITPHGEWQAQPGSGPRHVAIHPNGRWVYNINELTSTVDLLSWDSAKGALSTLSSISTLPHGATHSKAGACELLLSPDQRFLYASNRVGEDSFALFSIAPQTGELTLLQVAPNRNKHSRHIAIDTSGRWLLSANQFGDNISVLPRDSTTGHLGEQVCTVPLGGPSCLIFA